jgi:hypothetical protein
MLLFRGSKLVQVCGAGGNLSRRTLNKLEISDPRTASEKG